MPHIGSKIFLKFTSRWLFICHLRVNLGIYFTADALSFVVIHGIPCLIRNLKIQISQCGTR